MGAPLIDALVASGHRVVALARSDTAARAMADRGASVVRGDLGQPGAWERAARDAEWIFHAGLPRMVPPLRTRHMRRLTREAEAGARAVASASPRDATIVLASCAIGDAGGLLAIAAPGLAAERGLAGPRLRTVRLPWAYGRSGFINDVARGLSMKRFRVVGPGGNRVGVIGARDAAAALLAAAGAPPARYVVGEEDAPTQMELVHHICVGRGAPRPDHLPPRMASFSMGGVVVEALLADQHAAVVPPPGFIPRQSWRADLLDAVGT